MNGEAATAPLYRKCDSCGTPNGVIYHHREGHVEHYCPRCAQRYALYDTAYFQLEAQVRLAVEAWVGIWGTSPGIIDLSEQLGQIGGKLLDEYKAGTLAQEGVQPFRLAA